MASLHVKIPQEVVKKLDKFCKDRGENRSTFIRRFIYRTLAEHSYLDKEKKKAVGVEDKDEQS